MSFVPGRAIGNALSFNGTSLVTPSFANQATWTVGFAFQNASLGASNVNMPVLNIRDATTAQLTLAYNPSTRVFALLRGGTLLGTGTKVTTVGAWYYVEIKGFVDPTLGTVTVKVNTVSDITFGPGNTQVSANNFANNIEFRGPQGIGLGGTYFIDDLYILDSTGGLNNDFLGDMKVEGIQVLDAGFYAQWTPNVLQMPNFQSVQVLNDGLFNESNTVAQKDAFITSKLNRITGSIAAVQAVYWARNTDSTVHSINSLARIAGVDYPSAAAISITDTAFKAYQNMWEQDPSTSAAWANPAAVDAAQWGYNLNS
jgi:hypothetical protein